MKPEIGIGYRKVRKGEKIPANHEFWAWGIGPWSNCPGRTGSTYADHDRLCRVPLKNTTTKKPKEPKTMQTKKPGTCVIGVAGALDALDVCASLIWSTEELFAAGANPAIVALETDVRQTGHGALPHVSIQGHAVVVVSEINCP